MRVWDVGQPPAGEARSSLPSPNKPEFICHFSTWSLTASFFPVSVRLFGSPLTRNPLTAPGPAQCLRGGHLAQAGAVDSLIDSSESLLSCRVKKAELPNKNQKARGDSTSVHKVRQRSKSGPDFLTHFSISI